MEKEKSIELIPVESDEDNRKEKNREKGYGRDEKKYDSESDEENLDLITGEKKRNRLIKKKYKR